MGLARHGSGVTSTVRVLASQIHPVFMLPPLASSIFGALVANSVHPIDGLVHVLAICLAVYTAHIKDGYVDFYLRGEDDSHPLTVSGCRLALAGSTVGFGCCLAYLWYSVGLGAGVITLPTWFLGYFHAPQLDMNPVTATAGYPTGIWLAISGGYYVQTGTLSVRILSFATVLLLILSGVKVIDDSQDYDYDRSIGKRTVAVELGIAPARAVAYALMVAGMVAVIPLAVSGVFPPSTPVASLAFGLVAATAFRAPPELSTMLLIRGSYLFLAVLVAAVWFRPLG